MDDLSLIIRHCKRSRSTTLDLNGRGLNSVAQEIYQLTDIEVLDLSNNKLLSIDPKISNLTKLKLLNLSNNQIINLPQSITKLANLQVLNVSGNPLGSQFDPLLKKENQSGPNLQYTLNICFNSDLKLDNAFPTFTPTQPLTLKPEKPFGSLTKPSWLDDNEGSDSKNEIKDEVNLKKQLSETETVLAKEQQKIIDLQREIERLKLNQLDQNKFGFQMKSRNEFDLPEEVAQILEVDYNELEINEGISQGGFSIVHRGFYRGTPVAIKKVFNPNITPDLLADLSNEVDMLNRLRHPNIVLLMGIVSKPPNLCIITEFVSNLSLFNLLHMSKVDIKNDVKLTIAREIALAINFLHLSHIVHRDIKSHNVLLDDKFRVKLCDFGLAKTMDALNKGSMQFSGTPCYMAPEIFQKRAYDEKIDVFAFGTLLWELFSRRVPFEGLEPADVMAKVLKEDQLSMIGVPKKIQQLAVECRATDPKKRPSFNYILETLNNITSL